MEKPEHLVASMLRSAFTLCLERGGIVAADFLVAKAIRPGANDCVVAVEFDWHESTGVVRTDGTQDDEGLATAYACDT